MNAPKKRTTVLSALGYYGGKSGHPAGNGIGPWISRTIGPTPKDYTYAEPFAGMLGVLLQRPPAQQELVNDLDGWIVAWWRAVRDEPEKFGYLVENTPRSRSLFEKARKAIAEGITGDVLKDALNAHISIEQSMGCGTGQGAGGWKARYRSGQEGGRWRKWMRADIHRIADRIRKVQLENRNAIDVLKRLHAIGKILIYCDPPYADANTKTYRENQLDRAALAEALSACKGRVAVSGYGTEWDRLGWERIERSNTFRGVAGTSGLGDVKTEVLWMNFTPRTETDLFAEEEKQ